jgi:hypothetical protein
LSQYCRGGDGVPVVSAGEEDVGEELRGVGGGELVRPGTRVVGEAPGPVELDSA